MNTVAIACGPKVPWSRKILVVRNSGCVCKRQKITTKWRQEQATQKTTIPNARFRVGKFFGVQLLTHDQNAQLTKPANGENSSRYKESEAVLLFFYRSQHKSILFYLCPPVPFRKLLCQQREEKQSKELSLYIACAHLTLSLIRQFQSRIPSCITSIPSSISEVFTRTIELCAPAVGWTFRGGPKKFNKL